MVDSFVWVYTILFHSPIHVRFSCVFFTWDGLGLESQRQSACQQSARKRLVFNLVRPDSIAWNCGREARSFSPDSLWIFGSRLLLFFLLFPLFSAFFFLHFLLYHALSLSLFSPFSICFFFLSFSVFSWISFSFSNVHVRHLSGEPQSIEIAFDFALLLRPFLYLNRATKWAHLSPSKRYIIRGWCTWKNWLAGNIDFVPATLYWSDYRHCLDYLHVFLRREDLMYLRDFFERGSKKFEFELTGGLILDCSNVWFCSRLRKMRKMME